MHSLQARCWQAKSSFGHLGVQNIQGLHTESAKHLQDHKIGIISRTDCQIRCFKETKGSYTSGLARAPAHFVATQVPGLATPSTDIKAVSRMTGATMAKCLSIFWQGGIAQLLGKKEL